MDNNSTQGETDLDPEIIRFLAAFATTDDSSTARNHRSDPAAWRRIVQQDATRVILWVRRPLVLRMGAGSHLIAFAASAIMVDRPLLPLTASRFSTGAGRATFDVVHKNK